MTVTLFSKPACHLCDEMRDVAQELCVKHSATLVEIDITSDPSLLAQYRLVIPVLQVDGVKIACGRVDRETLVTRLDELMTR